MAPSRGADRPAGQAVAVRRRAQPSGRFLPRQAGQAAGDRAGGAGVAPFRRRRRPDARVVGRRGCPGITATRPPASDRRDLLPGLLGGRSSRHAGHTGGDREVTDVLRIESAQAGAAGTRAGAMTQIWECTDARLSLGVYVLGAIDPAERALVDTHLVTCRDCRDELAGLAGLLARVNPDEISRICADDTVGAETYAGADDRPPEELIGTVLDLAEARRRRTRWRFLAAAAAVVAIAGGLFGGLSSITTTRTVPVPVALPGTHWETVE